VPERCSNSAVLLSRQRRTERHRGCRAAAAERWSTGPGNGRGRHLDQAPPSESQPACATVRRRSEVGHPRAGADGRRRRPRLNGECKIAGARRCLGGSHRGPPISLRQRRGYAPNWRRDRPYAQPRWSRPFRASDRPEVLRRSCGENDVPPPEANDQRSRVTCSRGVVMRRMSFRAASARCTDRDRQPEEPC
jgi:hypothetical protein